MTTVQDILHERQKTHGSFIEHSQLAQSLKLQLRDCQTWDELSDMQRESLEMICHKIARVMCGNSCHKDHWDDIAGYATLVAQDLTNA
jgi:hypothetical protein